MTEINFEMIKTSTCVKNFGAYSKKLRDLKKAQEIVANYKIDSIEVAEILEKEVSKTVEYYTDYLNELRTRVFDDKDLKNKFIALVAKDDFELALAIDKEIEVKADD